MNSNKSGTGMFSFNILPLRLENKDITVRMLEVLTQTPCHANCTDWKHVGLV